MPPIPVVHSRLTQCAGRPAPCDIARRTEPPTAKRARRSTVFAAQGEIHPTRSAATDDPAACSSATTDTIRSTSIGLSSRYNGRLTTDDATVSVTGSGSGADAAWERWRGHGGGEVRGV